MSKVIVVGAGVVGLSAALVLAENGYTVTVVARNLPTDPLSSEYTSPWAGAHFRPFPSRSVSDKREMRLTRRTQEYFKTLAKTEPWSSVKFVQGIEYFEAPDSYYSKISYGYSEDMEHFKVLSESEIPNGCKLGTQYKTWVLNSPHYIKYLQNKLMFKYGVQFHKQQVSSLQQVFEKFLTNIVINCSGNGLQYDGSHDARCFPIRGQTLLVRAPPGCPYLEKTITHQGKDGSWTFVIPRPLDGGVILGGTKQPGDTHASPRVSDTEALVSRGQKFFPELFIDGELDIRNINVGFRPAREGGSRVEIELVTEGKIVHAYGAGGMGYELSYGMGQEVLKLVNSINVKSKL